MGKIERGTMYAILIILTIVVLIPFFSILSVAFTPEGEVPSGLRIPHLLEWSNFVTAWQEGGFANLLRNSAIVAAVVVPATIVVSTLAAYPLATMQFPGKHLLFYGILAGIVVPYEAIVIPLYFDLSNLGLANSLPGLMLPQAALFTCFGTFWMRAALRATPPSLHEAARLDGANSAQILTRILVPVSRQAISTLGVLVLIWSWNEFLLALILIQDPGTRTAPSGLGVFVGQFASDQASLAAAALLVTGPVLIFYLIAQRRVIYGMLEGATKE